jgi:hypothetical protein
MDAAATVPGRSGGGAGGLARTLGAAVTWHGLALTRRGPRADGPGGGAGGLLRARADSSGRRRRSPSGSSAVLSVTVNDRQRKDKAG